MLTSYGPPVLVCSSYLLLIYPFHIFQLCSQTGPCYCCGQLAVNGITCVVTGLKLGRGYEFFMLSSLAMETAHILNSPFGRTLLWRATGLTVDLKPEAAFYLASYYSDSFLFLWSSLPSSLTPSSVPSSLPFFCTGHPSFF